MSSTWWAFYLSIAACQWKGRQCVLWLLRPSEIDSWWFAALPRSSWYFLSVFFLCEWLFDTYACLGKESDSWLMLSVTRVSTFNGSQIAWLPVTLALVPSSDIFSIALFKWLFICEEDTLGLSCVWPVCQLLRDPELIFVSRSFAVNLLSFASFSFFSLFFF